MRRNALLRCGHEVEAQNPLRQRDLRTLDDGIDRYREGLLAIIAVDEAGPVALASQPGHALGFAKRANGATRPADALKMRAGGVFVAENGVR